MDPSSYDNLEKLLIDYVNTPGNKLDMKNLREALESGPATETYQLLDEIRSEKLDQTAIYLAAYRNQPETLKCLLDSVMAEHRYQLLQVLNVDGATPLHNATYYGYTDVVMCICNSLKPEQRYQLLTVQAMLGSTPLHYAAWQGHTELITYILDSVEPAQQIQLLELTDCYNETVLGVALLERDNKSTADRIKQYYQRDITSADGKYSNQGNINMNRNRNFCKRT